METTHFCFCWCTGSLMYIRRTHPLSVTIVQNPFCMVFIVNFASALNTYWQVAGYLTSWGRMAFATVRHAGHMVTPLPPTQPTKDSIARKHQITYTTYHRTQYDHKSPNIPLCRSRRLSRNGPWLFSPGSSTRIQWDLESVSILQRKLSTPL